MRRLRLALAGVLVVVLVPVGAFPPLAPADVAGPDDSLSQAFGPLVPGTLYRGAFTRPADVDYLAFDVAQAGQTLHFDVANTVRGCTSENLTGCPVYATLIDGRERQLGGEGSAAGTGPVTEDAAQDVIDWTFDTPGRYYVAMDSDGDLPTYSLRYRVVTPSAGTTAGPAGGQDPPAPPPGPPPVALAAPIVSLAIAPGQRGPAVRVRLRIGRALRSLTLELSPLGSATLAARRRASAVGPGRRTMTLRLDPQTRAQLARRGRLRLRLRVVAVPVRGPAQTLRRTVSLVRR